MTFFWPSLLYALFFVPLVVLIYLFGQQRRRAQAAGLGFFNNGSGASRRNPGLRRHVAPLMFLIGLAILLIALARPQAKINLPRVEGTVILVLDVSGSMAAEDAEPTRMEAAKTTAREFVVSQPETVQIGIVSFSGSGFTVQTPTNDTQNLLAAIDRLEPLEGTSLGQGILVALNTIAVDAGLESAAADASTSTTDGQEGAAQNNAAQEEAAQQVLPESELLTQLPKGPYPASVIVLLSDGENNQSIDPFEAAQVAADHAVRIDAIGFGTTGGITLEIDGFNVHTALDEDTLQQITQAAGGAYYNAQNEQDPQSVYAKLTPQLVVKPETLEITAIFAGISILIILLGAVFSLVWFNRVP